MPTQNNLIRQIGSYTNASIITQVITLAAALLTRKFLGPAQMGVWSLLQVVLMISPFLALGVNQSVSRQLPYLLARGESLKVDQMKNHIFSFAMLSAAMLSVGILVFAFVCKERLPAEVFGGLLLLSVIVMLQRLNNVHISFLRGYRLFSIASRQMMFSAVVNVVLVAALAYRFKIYGFMWAIALSLVFNIFYIRFHHNLRFHWDLAVKEIKSLIKYGFPLVISAFIYTLFLTVDRVMISSFLGFHALGLYSMAFLAYGLVRGIPNAVGVVLIPYFHDAHGRSRNPSQLKGHVELAASAFSALMPLLCGAAFFLSPLVINMVLPEFEGGTSALQFLVLAAFFFALTQPYEYFIVMTRRQLLLVPVTLVTLALAALFNYTAIRIGWGIDGVAAATTVAVGINFFAVFWLAANKLYAPREGIRRGAIWLIKFAVMALVLFSLKIFLSSNMLSFSVFTLLCLPMILKLKTHIKALRELSQSQTLSQRAEMKNA
jgi:O-antigen/teichoic acid export membrane protein